MSRVILYIKQKHEVDFRFSIQQNISAVHFDPKLLRRSIEYAQKLETNCLLDIVFRVKQTKSPDRNILDI